MPSEKSPKSSELAGEPYPALLLRIVFACAVVPLVVGGGLVAIYASTYASWVPTAELVFLVCAPGFFVAGGACLSLANSPSRRPVAGPDSDRFETRFWHRVVLLLLNIPAVIAGGFVINMLDNQTVIGIVNASGEVLDRCDVVAIDSISRRTDSRAMVPVNGQIRSEFTLDEEGTVRVTILQHNLKVDFDVVTTVRPGGIKQRVRVEAGLKYQFEPWE